MLAYYVCALAVSLLLLICYLAIWHKHFDLHITLIFVLVPIANLGYTLVATSQTLEAALVATEFSYIGGCYMLLILMLAVFGLCDIRVPRAVSIGLFCLSTAVYLSTFTIGHSPAYYADVSLIQLDGVSALVKHYGPMHALFIAMEIAYCCATFVAVGYSYLRKSQVSRKNLLLIFLTEIVAVICFFGGRIMMPGVELLVIAYDFALVVYLVISYRLCLYDVSDSAIDTLVENGEIGFVSFDFNRNYLGSNNTAKTVFPELNDLVVDSSVDKSAAMENTMSHWLKAFETDQANRVFHHQKGDKTYRISIQYLYSGQRKRGYQLFVVDDTNDQKYIELLNNYNVDLQKDVDEKTTHIVEMHNNLIMSMAVMVESRDNSTGGHIRRTSEGVRLLIAEMRAEDANAMTDSFCSNVVKAAPMHDLGKIAVDDAVLRKPGRFTPEEFEIMKTHAAEGARIVHQILEETDDEEFKLIAENVAHYHHERWDGSGYPSGLAGEEIPLEARIMAIADVYDALVSKRVYKDAMSFEKADAIIMDGMGSQFDKNLEPYYVRARPHLESYYADLS